MKQINENQFEWDFSRKSLTLSFLNSWGFRAVLGVILFSVIFYSANSRTVETTTELRDEMDLNGRDAVMNLKEEESLENRSNQTSKHRHSCQRKMDYSLIGTSATFDENNTLTFYIGNIEGLDTPASLRNDIYAAFNEWSQTGYKFKEVFSPHLAYIKIATNPTDADCRFHGRELAHAHSPKTETEGHICINTKGNWGDASRKFVIAHEIGHTLGIGHSSLRDAVMHPSSDDATKLHSDDLEAFYSLFERIGDPNNTEIVGSFLVVEDVSEIKYTDYEIAMWLLKSFEGLCYKPYWDVSQYSIGWGVRTNNPKEAIDLKEANKRTRLEYNEVYNDITKRYPHLERWDRLILACMDYNVGHFGEQLNKAIRSGNKRKIARVMRKYVHSSKGEKLEGLVRRRSKEVELLLASDSEKQKYAFELKNTVLSKIRKANNSTFNSKTNPLPCVRAVDQEKYF